MQANMTSSSSDGFVPDSQGSGDGFVADGFIPDQQPKGSYWDDVANSAGREVSGIVRNAPAMLQGATNIASIPMDVMKAPAQILSGTSPRDTSLGQDVSTVGNAIKASPGATADMAKGMWQTATNPKEAFRQRPIGAIGDASMIFGGGAALAEKAIPAVAGAADAGAMSLGRRSLGFSKRFLNTEGKAANAEAATRTALDEGVISPLATPDTMMTRAQDLQDSAGKKMGSIFDEENRGATGSLSPKAKPQLREQFLFDTSKAIDDLEALRPATKGGKVLRGGDYDAQNAAIDNAIDTIKAHGNRPIPWDEANQLKSHLQGLANYDTAASKSVNNVRKSIGGVFKDNLDSQLSGAMESGGRDSSIFGKAKKTWKASEDMQKGLQNRISSEKGNNAISLGDYAAGAAGNAAGPVGGVATIAVKKLFQKYGTTTGATALDKTSKLLSSVPKIPGEVADAGKVAVGGGAATKLLTEDKAREFLKLAKGNKNVARQLARDAGWSF